MEERRRVLFAGGCHVAGFGVGPENSFATIAMRALGVRGENARHLAYLNLRNAAERIRSECKSERVDYLVLQLGHYECGRDLRRVLRDLLPFASGLFRKEVAIPCTSVPFRVGPKQILLAFSRLIVAGLIALVGKGKMIFDPGAVAGALDSALESLDRRQFKAIFLLNPFLCLDPLLNACRRRSRPIFVEAARKHDCVFVDSAGILAADRGTAPLTSLFAEVRHLNREGHEKLGNVLGEVLRETVAHHAPKPTDSLAVLFPGGLLIPTPVALQGGLVIAGNLQAGNSAPGESVSRRVRESAR